MLSTIILLDLETSRHFTNSATRKKCWISSILPDLSFSIKFSLKHLFSLRNVINYHFGYLLDPEIGIRTCCHFSGSSRETEIDFNSKTWRESCRTWNFTRNQASSMPSAEFPRDDPRVTLAGIQYAWSEASVVSNTDASTLKEHHHRTSEYI